MKDFKTDNISVWSCSPFHHLSFLQSIFHAHKCSSQTCFLKMGPEEIFLILLLHLLHLAQATSCQGDNCPTGDFLSKFNLDINRNRNLLPKHISNNFNENFFNIYFSFLSAGLIISGGRGAGTSVETFPAAPSNAIPSFPRPGERCFVHFEKHGWAKWVKERKHQQST